MQITQLNFYDMKKLIKNISTLATFLFLSATSFAQTPGEFTFTFTQIPHTTVHGTKHNLAVWFQTESGDFIKTDCRFAGALSNDHLPTWSVNAGGPALDCLSPLCNVVNATAGATLANYSRRTVNWDGKNSDGEIVPDGVYRITLEQCWVHGDTGKTLRTYLFTKGPNSDIQLPADNADFIDVSLAWNSTAGINENDEIGVNISPNPTNNGQLKVSYKNAEQIKVTSISGKEVLSIKVNVGTTQQFLDLKDFESGVYFITVINGSKSSMHKLIVNN